VLQRYSIEIDIEKCVLTNFKSNDFKKTCIRNLLFKLQLAWAVARVLQRLRQTVIDRKRFD
jgi:hypothetical protein